MTPELPLPAKVHDASVWLRGILRSLRPQHPALPAVPADLESGWAFVANFCGLTPWQLAHEIARKYGLRTERLPATLDDNAKEWMKSLVVQECGAVLVRRADGYLVVAVAEPLAPDVLQRLSFVSDLPIELVVAPPGELRLLSGAPMASITPIEGKDEAEADEGHPDAQHDAPGGVFYLDNPDSGSAVVHLCNLMLRHAMTQGASDIHVQPAGDGGVVRMRIDGLLRLAGRMPLSVMRRLISRVKAVAGLDPTDRMRPQDGHARVVSATQTLDLRIATLPVVGGEKLVVRLLGGQQMLRLDDLDLPEVERRQIQNLIDSTMGAVLVAGPTGSGKTTTLYSILHEKNTTEVNIVTAEDPVEIRMPRLAQTEVNTKAGLTFATALRSIVRQDPDIVLIGEIRDADTAAIAMQAAITGRLVFASIHANDAVSVLRRLAELGVGVDLTGEAVRGILSQRLVRAVCRACAVPAPPAQSATEAWLMDHAKLTGTLSAVGCRACAGTGYKGRLGIMQVLTNSPEISRLLDHGAPLSEVRDAARGQGMRFLSESALDRVRRGQTTLDEVLRVMGADFWREMGVVFAAAPPAAGIKPAASDDRDVQRPAVLLFAKNESWRGTLAAWLDELQWKVVIATTDAHLLEAMAHAADFSLVVVDEEHLDRQRALVFLAMRATLAGAAVPLLVMAKEQSQDISDFVNRQPFSSLVTRPDGAPTLRLQIARALM